MIDVRRGMFGGPAAVTPRATDGWSARSRCRPARHANTADISMRSSTRLATVLGQQVFDARRSRGVVHRGQLTLEVHREHLLEVSPGFA